MRCSSREADDRRTRSRHAKACVTRRTAVAMTQGRRAIASGVLAFSKVVRALEPVVLAIPVRPKLPDSSPPDRSPLNTSAPSKNPPSRTLLQDRPAGAELDGLKPPGRHASNSSPAGSPNESLQTTVGRLELGGLKPPCCCDSAGCVSAVLRKHVLTKSSAPNLARERSLLRRLARRPAHSANPFRPSDSSPFTRCLSYHHRPVIASHLTGLSRQD